MSGEGRNRVGWGYLEDDPGVSTRLQTSRSSHDVCDGARAGDVHERRGRYLLISKHEVITTNSSLPRLMMELFVSMVRRSI